MSVVIEFLIELIFFPRLLLCAAVGFALYYLIGELLPESNWVNLVGVFIGISFMVIGIIWEVRANSNDK